MESKSFCHRGNLMKSEPYSKMHGKLKLDYRNKKIKKVYLQLLSVDSVDETSYHQFCEDVIISVSKLIRSVYLHRDQLVPEIEVDCLARAHNFLRKLADSFLQDQSFVSNTKLVNPKKAARINKFWTITIDLILQVSIRVRLKDNFACEDWYSVGLKLVQKVMATNHSSYKLLRKCSQFLLSYAAALATNHNHSQSMKLLMQSLSNEINILITIAHKHHAKKQEKRVRAEYLSRISNILICYSMGCFKQQDLGRALASLKHGQAINKLKSSSESEQVNAKFEEALKLLQLHVLHLEEVRFICCHYFSASDSQPASSLREPQPSLFQSRIQSNFTFNFIPKKQSSFQLAKPPNQFILAKSLPKNQTHAFTQDTLFYGVQNSDNQFKLRKVDSNKKRRHSSKFQKQKSFSSASQKAVPFSKYVSCNEIKLKKVGLSEQSEPKQVARPLGLNELEIKFNKFWEQESLKKNQVNEKMCLLKYKNQFSAYKSIIQVDSYQSPMVEIELKTPWPFQNNNLAEMKKADAERQAGIGLLRRIIGKQSKLLEIKRIDFLNWLKRNESQSKKRHENLCVIETSHGLEYLLKQSKKEEATKGSTNLKSQREMANSFLTKDRVGISKLFLSFMASSN